jgi:PAS domain S-box-containing protein
MYANQSTLKLFGCSAEQLVGKGDECFFPPDTVRQLREVDLRVFSGTRNEQEINVSGSGPAVSNRVYWEVKTPLYADPERQTVLGLLGISTDITERKRAEEALEESSERLRREKEFTETLIDSSPDTIFVFDPATGKAVVWNEAFRQVSGYTDEEIAGLKAPDSYYSTEDLQRAEETIKRVFEDGRGTVELTLLTKQGQAVPFEYNVSVLPGEGSATPVFISIGRDLTEHKQAEEALRLTRFTLEHVSDALFWITPDARLVDVNEAACRSLGYARDELLRLTVPDVDIQHSAAVWPAHFEELRRRGSLTFESVQRAKDGRLIPVEIVANYVQFGDKERNCAFVRDITKRKQAEEERRRIEEDRQRFFLLAESSSEFIGMCDLDLQPVYVNPAGRRMVGLPDMAAACRVKVPDYFYPEDQAFIANEFFPRVLREGHGDVEIRLRHFQTGEPLWFYYYLFSVHDAGGNAIGWATVSHDITERRRADEEKQMLQAQLTQALKMEAVGRLAGGVAHDFNNMLGVILGHTGMALEMAAPTDPLRGNLAAIEKAALRCADLTRQILAFARKQTVAPRAIDLNSTVEAMLKMLRRLIGEDIAMAWIPGEELWPVQVDPAQIDQIMANLCVNARDAIAGVGKITIETGNVVFDEAYCAAHAGSVPGEYVLLAVSDDGCGMDAETLSHVFEPFFTTKTLGQGTGLGLATVYGAVKQNQGFINVYSEPGQGTTIKIYLRRHAAQPEPAAEEGQSREAVGDGETILLVEDEPDILQTTTALVERLGYRVLAASTPGAALRLAREHTGRIDLLMTDVVMPEMNGRDLAKSIQSLYPDIGRLFMSGYTANVIAHHGVLDPGVHFLQKPFSMQDLGAKIREALRNG